MEVPKLSFSYIDGFSYPINFFILKKFPSLKHITYIACVNFLIKGRFLSIVYSQGPALRHEESGAEPHRVRGAGHDQQD